jgi:hypothetical protein
MQNLDTWGNMRGEPQKLIEETHGDNFVKISIYDAGGLYCYGYQLKMGTVLRQKAANIGAAMYKTPEAARDAAGNEIAGICAGNKNSKRMFADFINIRYNQADLFGGLL